MTSVYLPLVAGRHRGRSTASFVGQSIRSWRNGGCSAAQAAQEPAEKNLAQVEQLNQQQVLAQQEAQQRSQETPGQGGPRMTI
jgi:hypothetical protein